MDACLMIFVARTDRMLRGQPGHPDVRQHVRRVHHGCLAPPRVLPRAARFDYPLHRGRDRGNGHDLPRGRLCSLVRVGRYVPLPQGRVGDRRLVGHLAAAVGYPGRDAVLGRQDVRAQVPGLVQAGGDDLPPARYRDHRCEW